MKEVKRKVEEKKPEKDTDPFSKNNKAFRDRHDVSVSEWRRAMKEYKLQYG